MLVGLHSYSLCSARSGKSRRKSRTGQGRAGVQDRQPLILDREAELAAVRQAVTAVASGRGSLILMQGSAGIGKTSMLRAACAEAAAHGLRTLTARGLPLEQGFSYGIARQLLEPVRAAAGPGEWDALLDGAAGLARRVFDSVPLETPEDAPHATMHGLYWLTANLAASQPLVLAVDDAQWADTPSLRWLSYLAARIDGLPLLLLLAARSGPDQPEVLSELRTYPACVPLELRSLGDEVSAELVRSELGEQATPELCRAAYAATRGNPFLLDALVKAVRARGATPDEMTVLSLGPQPVADAMARRIGQLGTGAAAVARALAVLGRPAPLRHAAALAEMGLPEAALLTDQLREAGVLAAGALLEFEYPIVRTAIYDSIPPGMRAMAHAHAAALLEAEGADAERVGLHLLHSEPAADAHAVAVLRAAATAATGLGTPDTAARYLRRALAEPPPAAQRAALLLELGLALASDRDQAAVEVLRDAVAQAADRATPALLSAGVLGIWGHHDSAAEIALAGLSAPGAAPLVTEHLEAELFANSWMAAASAGPAWDRVRPRLDALAAGGTGIIDWHVYDALSATIAARQGSEVLTRFAPVLAGRMRGVQRDSLCSVIAMLVLIWNDELAQARAISDAVLEDARARGSMNMIANVCGLRSMILCRLGRLQEAEDDGRVGFDFKLKTSPPLAVAWAATFLVEALARLGRFDEAEEVIAQTEARRPPPGWLQTILFIQARGALRTAQQRYPEGLADLHAAADGWHGLGIASPAAANWRVPAVYAYTALGREQEAARLAAEQLELARAVGTPGTLGISLRVAAPFAPDPERTLAEAISLLQAAGGRYQHAVALTALGALRRRAGRRAAAKEPLRQALDFAERTGADQLREYARTELIAAGARPRRAALTGPDALTSAERQVADLAAKGRSNRQIAQHLFITQATVETHLRHAFHKLGITSRAELPDNLKS
ncbi:MAG TPA: AAA family ATPase [Trebonia sp.]|nr:AAA family ATPase [Trebonia sp.]